MAKAQIESFMRKNAQQDEGRWYATQEYRNGLLTHTNIGTSSAIYCNAAEVLSNG